MNIIKNNNNINKNNNNINNINNNKLYTLYPFLKPYLPLENNIFKISSKINIEPFKQEIINYKNDWTNKDKYTFKWKSITLKSYNGLNQDFLELHCFNNSKNSFKYTDNIHYFPEIKKFLDSFNNDIYLVRILKLEPHGLIKFHTDGMVFNNPSNIIRCHLPIITSPKNIFKIGNPIQQPAPGYSIWNANSIFSKYLEPGYIWYTNVNCLHSVENNSDKDRIHLVIDMLPTSNILKQLNIV